MEKRHSNTVTRPWKLTVLLGLNVLLAFGCESDPTGPADGAPEAPEDLLAQTRSQERVDLSWTNAADLASGYVVERRLGQAEGFEEIAQLNSESTNNYSDGGLHPGSEYCYRVNAFRGISASEYSNVSCTVTLSQGAPSDDITLDPRIPDVPQPSGPQPMTLAFSEAGETVGEEPIDAINAVAVGRYYQARDCVLDDGWKNDGSPYKACVDDFYARHQKFLDDLEVSGGTSTACNPSAIHVRKAAPDTTTTSVIWASYCVTFHDVTLKSNARLRYDRIWRNVTSRVLGPGTTYSITYKWTDGVETTNGFDWSSTTGTKTMNEKNWNNCVGGSVKTSATAGVDIPGLVKAEATVEAELHDEFCFGEKSAQETTTSLSKTVSQSQTVRSERGGEETTAVVGAEGADRVYTVWQLVDQYSYVKADGERFEASDVASDSAYTDVAKYFTESPDWIQIEPLWPNQGALHQNTQLFAQSTRDFPFGASSAVSTQQIPTTYFSLTPQF